MVSRANVPRKMTSATRLTEAEKIELEWESVWERIGASVCKIQREQEVKLDKILRSLQDLRSTMEARDASSGSCKSQVELSKFSDNLDFQKSIDVDRAIADEDLMEQHSSGRYEEMDTEFEIGVEDCASVSKEIEGIQFLEVMVTPLQKIEESGELKKMEHVVDNLTIFGKEKGDSTNFAQFAASLMVHRSYYLPLKWLLDWGPKPMVKMKLMAHHGEVIEEDLNSMVFPISKKFKEAKFLAIVLQNAMTREFVVTLIVVREVRLSVWNPKPNVKMKLMKFASRVGYEEETTDLGKAYKEVCEEVSIALDKSGTEPSQWGSLSGIGWMPRPLFHDRWERMNENKDSYLFALLLFQQETSILMAIEESSKMVSLEGDLLACQRIDGKYVERDERAAALEQTGVYIVEGDIDDVSLLKKLFELVSFTHVMHLASHAGVRYAKENPSYYVHSNMAGSVKPQLSTVWAWSSSVYGLNTNVSFSERDGTDQLARLYAATKKAGKEIAHTYNHIHGLSITELRFFTGYGLWGRPGMAYFFFTRDILQGKSIPILEAARHETVAVGKSTGSNSVMKKAYQLSDIDWLVSIWFPKPTVKMKHERLGSGIPCGQGILWGMECYDHNLRREGMPRQRILRTRGAATI